MTKLLLDRVPRIFRRVWPLRRFYWQQSELDAIKRSVAARKRAFGWDE